MRLLYFAWVRERIGAAEETIEPPATVETVGDLLRWLRTRGDAYEQALTDPTAVRVALDQFHAEHDASIAGVREVALFPPMTGG
ncbi:molybdopterin converting factor subunit 1 [Kaistia dalseonensis]|uniref:Molybdopterin synthase sulfur carrier subunit n=1 Tax=Kaistia dalseonensis TaxID=410840 RepID=A0ABU0H2Q8_9HYPH|nr:molybdopterin converting factor subunit 1 [Kaistia dalseonensis]MCX5493224.1 molybdopterin converting factor subunit 1 [Kaistia dalseonensis]MDQ0435779.1 molybdopterin synthase sulfur carrier subunit [Kaistia dalseonensis]